MIACVFCPIEMFPRFQISAFPEKWWPPSIHSKNCHPNVVEGFCVSLRSLELCCQGQQHLLGSSPGARHGRGESGEAWPMRLGQRQWQERHGATTWRGKHWGHVLCMKFQRNIVQLISTHSTGYWSCPGACVLLLNLCICHGSAITNTMYEHEVIVLGEKITWLGLWFGIK